MTTSVRDADRLTSLARLEAAAEERAAEERRQAGCCGDPELFALHLRAERRYVAKAGAHRATIEFLRRSHET